MINYKRVLLISFTVIFHNISLAQKNYRLPKNISSNDYVHGKLLVKLKPEFKKVFDGEDSYQRKSVLKYGLKGKTLFPQQEIDKPQRKSGSNSSKVDISRFYELDYDANENIEEVINELINMGIADIIEPMYIYKTSFTPNDSLLSRQYYLENTKAFKGWEISKGNTDIVIGVVDSGIDLEHPDLKNKLQLNEDEIPDNGIDDDNDGYIDNYRGWDFAGSDTLNPSWDNNPQQVAGGTNGHGTWVTGIIAAETNNNIGIAGVGFNCKFIATKHSFDNQREDNLILTNPYAGIVYLTTQEVDIINLSWGGSFRSEIVQELINFAALEKDILIIAAAGNENTGANHYPSGYDNVISVAALDARNIKSSFSNFGSTVDISAPGSIIFTTDFKEAYRSLNGTSFASPIVAGAAGLVKAHYPDLSNQQIGDVLKSTTDAGILDSVANNGFGLGNGLLNIENALTAQPPSIKQNGLQIMTTKGSTNLSPSDTLMITANFTNRLWKSGNNLRVKVTSNNSWATLLRDEFIIGALEMGESRNNNAIPFQMALNPATPLNTIVTLRFNYADDNYQDFEYFSFKINPSFINIEKNEIATTMTGIGKIGYEDNNQRRGIGFGFNNQNLLFEMGLIMGSSSNNLSNAVRGELTNNTLQFDEDFNSVEQIRETTPGERSISETFGVFNNEDAPSGTSPVSVSYETLVFTEALNDKYVIVEYTITNNGEDEINDYYVGLFADWDVSITAQDQAGWYNDFQIGYVNNSDQQDTTFVGIQVLTASPNYYPINNNEDAPESPFGIYDGFTKEEKFTSISNGLTRLTSESFPQGESNDVSHVVSGGPYQIPVGDSITVAFALHGALGFEDFTESAEAAWNKYNTTLQLPQPTISFVPPCKGTSTTVTALGGINYKWYESQSSTTPFFEGDTYMTTPLFSDTTFYVSALDDQGQESTRKKAVISLSFQPNITVDKSSTICEGDTATLTASIADSYLWSNGSTNRSISVAETGNYAVTLTIDSLDCTATSDSVKISVLPVPQAIFSMNISATELGRNNFPLQLTDKSTNAVAWNWDFGNGTISQKQNPTIQYDEIGTYTITLTVRNVGGCTSSTSKEFVVTSLEKELFAKSIALYPNPNNGNFNLLMENEYKGNLSVSILDISGRLVVRKHFQKLSNRAEIDFNLKNETKGLYLIKIESKDFVVAKKVLLGL